ncbi:MAG: hypothetical protein GEU80_14330 [Dehalococcoidia bacterium]|nr:hypothetical protein [Dehalococcoidia bacterium]
MRRAAVQRQFAEALPHRTPVRAAARQVDELRRGHRGVAWRLRLHHLDGVVRRARLDADARGGQRLRAHPGELHRLAEERSEGTHQIAAVLDALEGQDPLADHEQSSGHRRLRFRHGGWRGRWWPGRLPIHIVPPANVRNSGRPDGTRPRVPIYPYRCPACRAEFEVSRRLQDRNQPVLCPADGAESTRLLTAPSLLGSARQDSEPSLPGPAEAGAGLVALRSQPRAGYGRPLARRAAPYARYLGGCPLTRRL